MTDQEANPLIKNWGLDQLQPHPANQVFNDLNDVELQDLADDMDQNGLKHPLDILPDGTVIGGHQRLRAAKLLEWEEIACHVRHDLADAGEDAVEEYLIQDNVNRRHMTMLEKARALLRLKEISREQRRGANVWGDTRDILGKKFGMSGRTLSRWENVLATPLEVQNAVEAGTLPMTRAMKVSGLPEAMQEEIAERIAAGDPPREVVKEHISKRKPQHSVKASYFRLLRELQLGHAELNEHVDDFDHWDGYDVLTEAQELIARIKRHLKRNR